MTDDGFAGWKMLKKSATPNIYKLEPDQGYTHPDHHRDAVTESAPISFIHHDHSSNHVHAIELNHALSLSLNPFVNQLSLAATDEELIGTFAMHASHC